jgi:thiol-disulfide isomerase/thioredoxin
MPRRRLLQVLGAIAVVAIVVIGLTQAGSKSKNPADEKLSLAQQQERLAGAPEPYASLHRQASQLLGGGNGALQARIKALRGHPVVINKWASWCGPCRVEFPVFERVGSKLGKRVAFIGLDSGDNAGDARQWLKQNPVSYPSYHDLHAHAAHALGAGRAYPTTVFIDAKGNKTVHQGPYDDDATLEQDIRRYALDA